MLKTTISRVAGMASVLGFVGLLTLIIYTQVQGEPDVVEEQYPPATHPLVGIGPEDLPKTPIRTGQVLLVDLVEGVFVDCTGDAPGLRVASKEELPQGATIRIRTLAPPTADSLGNRRWPTVGSVEEFAADGVSRDEYVPLSDLLRSNLDGGAESVGVTITYTDAAGRNFVTIPEHIAAADLVC